MTSPFVRQESKELTEFVDDVTDDLVCLVYRWWCGSTSVPDDPWLRHMIRQRVKRAAVEAFDKPWGDQ